MDGLPTHFTQVDVAIAFWKLFSSDIVYDGSA